MSKEQETTNQHKEKIIQATREYFENKYNKPNRNRKKSIKGKFLF